MELCPNKTPGVAEVAKLDIFKNREARLKFNETDCIIFTIKRTTRARMQ